MALVVTDLVHDIHTFGGGLTQCNSAGTEVLDFAVAQQPPPPTKAVKVYRHQQVKAVKVYRHPQLCAAQWLQAPWHKPWYSNTEVVVKHAHHLEV